MSERSAKENMERRRRKHVSTTFLSFVICMFFCASALGVYAGFRFTENEPTKNFPVTKTNSKDETTILPTVNRNMTVMLMGVDERKDDVGRSDTLMFLSFNRDDVSLLSIPRDTRVYIERQGYQKINAAYAFGGEKLARQTVEDFLGVDVDRYIKIDTRAFPRIIDEMGGIEIYVERDMHYEDPWDDDGGLVIDLKQGLQHLDGDTAIQFVRFRDSEGDVGRVRRQQAFMKACADRLSEPSMLIKIPELLGVAVKAIDTDLSSGEMLAAAGTLKSAEAAGNVKTGVVPGWLQYIDGVSYLIPDGERLGKVMRKNLDFDVDRKHFEELAYEYTPGSDADYYDVNFNPEKDLRLMNYLDRHKFNLSDNEL